MSLDRFGTTFEIKQVEQRVISGHAAAWALDRVGDVIDHGAFRKTLSEKRPSDVAVFVGHKADELPVGVPIRIEPDEHGLFTQVKVFDGPAGDNLLAVAKGLQAAGQTLGLSIGYRVRGSKLERIAGKSVRRLTDIDLIEFSYAARQTVANPAALMTDVKALSEGSDTAGGFLADAEEGKAMKVEQRGDKFHVVGSDGTSMGSYDTEAAAKAAMAMHQGGKTVNVNDLPDSAFLIVEAGGQKDDEGKTVPRSKRHFPYLDAAGAVDQAALKTALTSIPGAGDWLDREQKTRLQTRARTLLDSGADWKAGAALDVRAFAYRLLDLSDQIAAQHKAMALLGEDTKGGTRIRAEMRAELKSVADEIGKAITWAETIDKGEDGLARLALLERELELLEV